MVYLIRIYTEVSFVLYTRPIHLGPILISLGGANNNNNNNDRLTAFDPGQPG